MRKLKFIILLLILTISCEKQEGLYYAIDNSNQIYFKINRNTVNKNAREKALFAEGPNFAARNKNEIKSFKTLFEGSKSTQYCCCTNIDFKIQFYTNNNENDYFYVDTSTLKDSVIVFEKSYQSSKRVLKSSWNKFLTQIENN